MIHYTIFFISIFLIIYLVDISYANDNNLNCKNMNGKSVDWYIIYKLPRFKKSSDALVRRGAAFAYMDADNADDWTSSGVGIDQSESHAVYHTLQQIYDPGTESAPRMHAMYNDEKPDSSTSFYYGHTKGTLSFDSTSGFWLVHSVPRFPPIHGGESNRAGGVKRDVDSDRGRYAYPHSGLMYGQAMLCVSFSAKQLENIAHQFLYTTPWIYSSLLPGNTSQLSPTMADIIGGVASLHLPPWSRRTELVSLAGLVFTNYAKHRQFGADLYDNIVAPSLKQNLLVESWHHGKHNMPSNCSIPYKVMNVKSLYLESSDFLITDDHSKWCIASDNCTLCIGDINRQYSQEHRGGGTLCMCHPKAHKNFNSIIKNFYHC